MNALVSNPAFQVIALAIGVGVFLLSVVAVTMAKFYRRCGADEALVRTGAGGNRVVIGGGITVYPILHQLMRVSLRSNKLCVEREGKNALVTKDKIKANVTTELYVKVEPLSEDVLAAARSFGERSLDEHAIATLIEGKLTDALRSVAANQTFMDLHSQRKQFAEHIQNALSEELKKNGLTLENVSITAFAMVPVTELDARDVFDAEGLRAITESVQSNAEKTNSVQREKELAIRLQNVEAKKRTLALEQDQAHAEADQQRHVAEYAATQRAETSKAVYLQEQSTEIAAYDKQRLTETARIVQEQAIAVAQAARLTAEQVAEIARMKTTEAATIEKQIAIVQNEELAARAVAVKTQADAEVEAAKQSIITVEETARANRQKAIAILKAEEEAASARIAAEQEAYARKVDAEAEADAARVRAEGEAEAARLLAEATLKRGEAEAEAKRLRVAADNGVATKLLLRDVTLKALEVLPAVTKELMTPAQAIREIKVLQLQGAGGGVGSDGAPHAQPFGVASPILKTILEAGAAYPLLREMMQFAQVDAGDLGGKALALLEKLPAEIRAAVESDPELVSALNGAGKAAAPVAVAPSNSNGASTHSGL